jgi:hypothetical protein
MAELRAKYRYEQDLYWTHQLFVQHWVSGLPQIVKNYQLEKSDVRENKNTAIGKDQGMSNRISR